MAVSKRLRFEILRRDGHTCIYCGASAPDVKLTVDHVVPVTLGGSDEADNLVTACQPCNAGKSSIAPDAPIVESVKADAVRWREAMMACATVADADRENRDYFRDDFLKAWNKWTYTTYAGETKNIDLPLNWPLTLDNLRRSGLLIDDVWDAVDLAMRARGVNDQFSYFAGICWKQVSERQEMARQMLTAEDEGND